MTVVLAVMCADGVVIAADSQITDSARSMSYPARKLHPLGDRAAWGGSGARAVLNDLRSDFTDAAEAILERDDVARALQERVHPVLQHHYRYFIEDVPGEPDAGGPGAYLLAAGYTHHGPFIVEVTPHAMVDHYEDIGFHAVGSGAALARQAGSLLSHFRMTERPLRYGVLAVVRVLEALALTAPSVGGPFTVCRIDPDGAVFLSDDEVDAVCERVAEWQSREQKVLDELFD